MKLLTVLMLIALPLSCFAGSGCALFERVVNEIVSPEVSASLYLENFQEFIDDESTANALKEMKKYFLGQDSVTLDNIQLILETIYESVWCAEY